MKRILIADDDIDLRTYLIESMKDAGYSAIGVKDGADAIVAVVEGHYDLALLDMLMPGLNGLQAIRVMRKVVPKLPIIGLTGYVGQGFMAQANSYGVTCLSKPVELEVLLKEIQELLGKNESTARVSV